MAPYEVDAEFRRLLCFVSAAGSFELRKPSPERIPCCNEPVQTHVVPQWWWEEAEYGVVRRDSHGFTEKGHQCLPYQDALLLPHRHPAMTLSDEVKREIGQVSQ